MSRGKIIFVVMVAASALLVYFMIIDSDFSKNFTAADLPDILVERVNFTRMINDREWRVKAVDAESMSGTINARSLDINILERDSARETQVYALRGEYFTESENMLLHDVDGTAWLGDRSIDFSAKRAEYDASSDVWFLSGGVSASDDRIIITAGAGRIDPDGVLDLEEGARVLWDIE